MSILDKQIVLSLNRSWLAVGMRTPRQAFVSLSSGRDGDHPSMALDFEVVKDENGEEVLTYATPVTWEEWLALPIRPQDLSIRTAKQEIRVPTVIVAVNFNKVPRRRAKVSARTIFERDGGRCQYTDKALTRSNATLDHVQPRSRGGRDVFENLVLCDKDVNMAKADRTPAEAGLTLRRQPKAPAEMPVIIRRDQANHESWLPFLSV